MDVTVTEGRGASMPEGLDLKEHPHRRLNLLTGEWVLVSPHRTKRPWQGQVEKVVQPVAESYDPQCYLCPGNMRAGGLQNPDYTSTFVFDNDFAALLPQSSTARVNEENLLVAEGESGVCRVICFSPRHDLTLARLGQPALEAVIDMWCEQYLELGSRPDIGYVQIFENRGVMMGASNPHPHGQIWATRSLPNEILKEQAAQAAWWARRQETLLTAYLRVELERAERIVCANQHFVSLAPFWALWPFETMVVSRRAVGSMPDMTAEERSALAAILLETVTRYDNLFEVSFPYSMGFHQSPTDGQPHPEWHFHGHFYPPLLRSATVRKFMVGYEMLGTPQRDITPELAAARLREVSATHYLDRAG
ncbi:MAG: UDP-glucose--hexose-1-phosphate uridylyltransferase [Bryobacterales bacterium]|jgi:UDPglucose--hexose-1-phosphate uridylyltransferase|nr:UDP-glucose--hexose-1-phosphate uridylyltransferase [Bryobacterales bacterium]